MNAFASGLDTLSNNVANLNTPGFKFSIPVFSEVVYLKGASRGSSGLGSTAPGSGVSVDTSKQSFRQGDLRDTGNPLDVAIDGTGYFILDRNGESVFSRAGQFEFDANGILVERNTKARVVVGTSGSIAAGFDIDPYRALPARATTKVTISGNLSRTPPTGSTEEPYSLTGIQVLDGAGGRQALSARFLRSSNDPLDWSVEVLGTDGAIIGSGTIGFSTDGTLRADRNTVAATVKATGLPDFNIVLTFGEPGSFSGTNSRAGTTQSSLQVLRQDGVEAGSLTQASFDERGRLQLAYSNGETRAVAQLLLAQFGASNQLQPLGNGLFVAATGKDVPTGNALSAGLGRVVGGRLELSNVELTEQFTDLIIIQRGYQGSSQVASVANEMIQQLLKLDGQP